MKHIIYAIVCPDTQRVRYVGKTGQTPTKRLSHHLGAARRGVERPIYAWIRSLGTRKPLLVVLEEVEYTRTLEECSTESREILWMKRFEKTGLLLNSVNKQSRAYRRYVNTFPNAA